jgi:hypothetical protein
MLTFGEMRLCLMRDFQAFVTAEDPSTAARMAIERADRDNLWPAYPEGWEKPWGLFLRELAPFLEDPSIVLNRYHSHGGK